MNDLLNHMQLAALRLQGVIATNRVGVITTVDSGNNLIKVSLQPEGIEIGWVPVIVPLLGFSAPPIPGSQAIVLFQEGSSNVPVGALLIYGPTNTANIPPPGINPGEFYYQHQSGSNLKFSNDGSVTVNAAGSTVELGNGVAAKDFIVLFTALKNYIDNHTHTGVQTGSGTSGAPSSALPTSASTTVVKAA